MYQNRLAAALRPDPLGELTGSRKGKGEERGKGKKGGKRNEEGEFAP